MTLYSFGHLLEGATRPLSQQQQSGGNFCFKSTTIKTCDLEQIIF